MFREHHRLFGVLFLRENIGNQALPGLLQRHNSDISCLESLCRGVCADVALTSLVGTQQLTRADLTSPTDSVLQILSTCNSLTACTLGNPAASLDLVRLKRVPKLVYLALFEGAFSVPLTSQLTTLALSRAVAHVSVVWERRLWAARACHEVQYTGRTRGRHLHWAKSAHIRILLCSDIKGCLHNEY